MKRLVVTVALFSLFVAGCKKPSEVIVTPPDQTTVVKPIADSTGSPGASDSTTVFAEDEQEFGGLLEVVMVKNVAWSGRIDSLAYARAFFADRAVPVAVVGKPNGYTGLMLDSVTINGVSLVQKTHFAGLIKPAGYEYRVTMTASYRPNALNSWRVVADSLGTVTASIRSPDDLRIIAPRSGSVVPKNRALDLEWLGSGKMTIVVSAWDSARGVAIPALSFDEDFSSGFQRIGPIILASLAARFPHLRFFMISYILENRSENYPVARYRSNVLVHTVLVYNTYIELQ
jgi:hypothetical protein